MTPATTPPLAPAGSPPASTEPKLKPAPRPQRQRVMLQSEVSTETTVAAYSQPTAQPVNSSSTPGGSGWVGRAWGLAVCVVAGWMVLG